MKSKILKSENILILNAKKQHNRTILIYLKKFPPFKKYKCKTKINLAFLFVTISPQNINHIITCTNNDDIV